MTEVKGYINWIFVNNQSKSEGYIAVLTTDEGEEYKLYRPDIYPINDSFFESFDSKRVEVTGSIEERTRYICVSSIKEISNDDQK